MRPRIITSILIAVLIAGVISSCKKDEEEYVLENQPVTGNFTYVVTSMTPTAFDTASGMPIAFAITMEGNGTVTEMGNLTMDASFNFNLVTGQGTDFVTTYSGDTPTDTFISTGTSQQQQDGTILVNESFSNGTGMFGKIKGGGVTTVILNQTSSGGTGTAAWTVTY